VPANKLDPAERARILAVMNSARFVDLPPIQIYAQLLDEGVSTRRGIMCVHREPAYDREPWSCGDGGDGHGTGGCSRLRQSERAQDHAIILPLFHQFTGRDQTVVAEALRATCRRA